MTTVSLSPLIRSYRSFVASLALLLALLLQPGRSNAYWQQHVSYDIRVTLNDATHTLDGTESILYSNHSPDTLREIYIHLYYNAFEPGSMMDVRARAIHASPVQDRIAHLSESEQGHYWINEVSVDGAKASFEITGTVLHATLPRALLPGGTAKISLPFRVRIPRQTRRGGWMTPEGVEYSMAQWYPKLAEYDVEGWHRQEYVSHEFFGVWGDYHVEITLPKRFTVGASGHCENPQEVGHGYEQIAAGQKQGLVTPGTGEEMLTWKFNASPVHDFAWVADDHYVHEWKTWQDTVIIHALYKDRFRFFWEKNALNYSVSSLQTYSDTFGHYPYHDFSTTMAGDGGMEYPQLIQITGARLSPLSLSGVIAHEIAHQWFYGLLGSNETREAFMDEGFTTYATTIAMNAMFGDEQRVPGQQRSWLDGFLPSFSNKSGNYRGYQEIASQHYEEPLVIPHDWLRESATQGQVYGKTQAILSMLQYTLGDSVFGAGMKAYYNEWHFKHPHLTDFKRVMERVSHTDLDWFIDQWFRSTRTLDYEAGCVTSHERPGGGYATTVSLKNNDLAVMPMDLLLHYADGSTELATVPLVTNKGAEYHKSGVRLFFPGWDWVNPTYEGTLITPREVTSFEIDTSLRLQDLNYSNNHSSSYWPWSVPGEWAIWKQLFLSPPIDRYYAVARPILWPDARSGMNAGLGVKYGMNNSGMGDLKIIYKAHPGGTLTDSNGTVQATTGSWYEHVDGALTFKTPVDWVGRLGTFGLDLERMYGISTVRAALTKVVRPEYWRIGPTHTFTVFVEDQQLKSIDRSPVWHDEWGIALPASAKDAVVNAGPHTQVAGLKYSAASERRDTRFDLLAETSASGSDVAFSRMKGLYTTMVSPLAGLDLQVRLTAGSATANTPMQRVFHVGRADAYEEQSSGFFRAVTSASDKIGSQAALYVAGGAGVRGYNNAADACLMGTQMAGLSLDVPVTNPLASLGSFASTFALGLFADAGWTGENWSDLRRELRTDAGLTISAEMLSWLPSQLRGVADEYATVPVVSFHWAAYENHPTDGTAPLAWRWSVSLGTAF